MKKPIIIILCIAAALLALAFYVFGWGGMLFKPKVSTPVPASYQKKQEVYDYIENNIKDNVSLTALETILKITTYLRDEEVLDVTVRVYANDGLYIPQAAAEICPLVIESVQEKGYTLGRLTVQEYFEDMKEENKLSASTGDETYFNVALEPVDSAEKLFFTIKTR